MKRSKKNSDEDKSVRKKKSKLHKRRRRDSSSSSPYSTESEDGPRAQRRQRRRKKGSAKSEKQIKESRKSGWKKSRRSSRRRISASPSSGRSCSTCDGSSSGSSADGRRRKRRSRSPVALSERKRKSRARSGSRGRSRRRRSGQKEGSRLRSPSCSTCRSRSVSSSSRGRSPVRSRRTKESDMEIEKPKTFLSEEVELRNSIDNVAKRDKNVQAGSNSASSQIKDDAYQVQRKLETHLGISEVKNSASAGRKDGRANEEDGELVTEKAGNQPYKKGGSGDEFTKKNDNPSSSFNSVADLELILRQKALENFRKFRGGASSSRASIANVENKVSETKDDPSEVVELRQKALESHRKNQGDFSANRRTNADMENEAKETHDDPPEVTEMRRKALENFRKSQGGILVNSRPAANQEKRSDQTVTNDKPSGLIEVQDPGTAVPHSITTHEEQVRILGDNRQSGRRIKSIVTIPETSTMKQNICSKNSSDISEAANMCMPDNNSNKSQTIHTPVEINKSFSEAPSVKTSLEEGKQPKKVDTEPGSHAKSITNITEADVQLISGVSAPESESRDETNVGNAGSQFQEKKFSRMHDGELVQVSYKVYIPTRPPALARRKLQR